MKLTNREIDVLSKEILLRKKEIIAKEIENYKKTDKFKNELKKFEEDFKVPLDLIKKNKIGYFQARVKDDSILIYKIDSFENYLVNNSKHNISYSKEQDIKRLVELEFIKIKISGEANFDDIINNILNKI